MTQDLSDTPLLRWFIRLRWVSTAVQLTVIVGAIQLFDFPFQPVLTSLVVLLVLFNSLLPIAASRGLAVRPALGAALLLDTLTVTLILGGTGGVHNPFTTIYLSYIAFSATLLGSLWTWAVTVLSIIAFRSLFLFAPTFGHEHHGGAIHQTLTLHLQGMWVAFSLSAVFIAFFVTRLAETLRQREEQLRELEKIRSREAQLAALTTLAAGAAHELATPLGTIAVVAKELQRALETHTSLPDEIEDTKLIGREVARCRDILERMSGHAPGTLDEPIVSSTVSGLLRALTDDLGVKYPVDVELVSGDGDSPVDLPLATVLQAVRTLVKNGFEASVEGSRVHVAVKCDHDRVSVTVDDQGSGMSRHVRERVGEPFFTTKEPGRGLGLGVFLVRLAAERLGGSLSFLSREPCGTSAVLTLPASVKREVRAGFQ